MQLVKQTTEEVRAGMQYANTHERRQPLETQIMLIVTVTQFPVGITVTSLMT